MMKRIERGFTLIELVLVILLIGIMVAVAGKQLSSSVLTAREEQTKKEMDQLARAIVGNPASYASGAQADFGYVGDVGGLPPNLDALVTNPGGYTTWDGPYIEAGPSGTDFKKDGWNTAYTLGTTTITSTGSGTNFDKCFASSASALTSNTVSGSVVDASNQPPGTVYDDSVIISITYPNGSGSTATASTSPNRKGSFSLSGIPIGNRMLRIVINMSADTLTYPITVYPGRTTALDIVLPADFF